MQIPFFYISGYAGENRVDLDEETSRHVVQVLRKKKGEQIHLTDGNGRLLTAAITEAGKKHCEVRVLQTESGNRPPADVSIAISLLRNPGRFEWFLEKATEIGVRRIIPLICDRTGKEKFRHERMKAICVSAMLQSRQVWLPELQAPVEFERMIAGSFNGLKLLAHCGDGGRSTLSPLSDPSFQQALICIGPEGDFTAREIELAQQHGFLFVSLGDTRLRSETAGVVAAALLVSH